MKPTLLFVLGLATPIFAAAPDSIAGKVYRSTTAIASIRQTSERTVIFGSDGRFVSLKYGLGSPLDLAAPSKIFLQTPPPDGSYVYQKVSDSVGTAEMTFDDGTHATWTFSFNTAFGGDYPDSSFTLTDAVGTSAPIANVSLRGRVSPGQPLIAGFVVPGPAVPPSNQFLPSSKTVQREVLIRVVGPSLDQFGISGGWTDPDFKLYQGSSPAVVNEGHYPNWPAAMQKIFTAVGAFPLPIGSKDAADVVRLNPGAYSVVCIAADGDAGGEVLIEVYVLP